MPRGSCNLGGTWLNPPVDDSSPVLFYRASMSGGLWTRLRQAGGRHPLLVDGALAGSAIVVSVILGHQEPLGPWRGFDGLGYALTCLVNITLVARRRAPVLVLLIYGGLWTVYVAAGYWPVVNSSGAMLALYTIAASRPPRVTAAAATFFGVLWMYGGLARGDNMMATVISQSIVWPAVICYVGNGTRRVVEQGRQLAVLAEQLRRDREERARRAVTDERIRIARELHDVVAHHMSVVSVQAGLARYVLQSDPGTAGSALDTVLGTTGEALDEMRRLLAVLRTGPDDSEPYDPTPGLYRIDGLAQRVRRAGVPVEVVVVGQRRPLAPGVDLCAYRVVQESLTNVLKHAAPARATVTLQYEPDRFTARVIDDGRNEPTGRTDGHGLIGMTERAKLYGGTLTAAPRPEGGFEVVLTVPTTVTADPTTAP
jgi:signal transduction histidine kinase